MNDFRHSYIEPDKIINESNSKHYKRLLVGLIRYLKNSGDINIPEEYFQNIPDNLGFLSKIENISDPMGSYDQYRIFELIDNWRSGIDDDGGEEELFRNIRYKINTSQEKHLKVIK